MFKDVVRVDGKQYEVSTVDTYDAGWETIIFEQEGAWRQWYVAGYADELAAVGGHSKAIREAAAIIAADPEGHPMPR